MSDMPALGLKLDKAKSTLPASDRHMCMTRTLYVHDFTALHLMPCFCRSAWTQLAA